MLLPVQIQSILYHFLMGWVYGLGFSFLLNFVKYMHVSFLRGTMEILFHVLFTSLLYYGLYGINLPTWFFPVRCHGVLYVVSCGISAILLRSC